MGNFAHPYFFLLIKLKRDIRYAPNFVTFNFYILRMFLKKIEIISSVFFYICALRRRALEEIWIFRHIQYKTQKYKKWHIFFKKCQNIIKICQI